MRSPGRDRGGEKAAYVVKVTLLGVQPPVWRRILVPAAIHLGDLHRVLQVAMGWTGSHLHVFCIGKAKFGTLPPEGEKDPEIDWGDERTVTLQGLGPGAEFLYEYDFGDNWKHRVKVEGAAPATSLPAPPCIGGARACPPEDCGGRSGYAELLDALADPGHERHGEIRDWLGRDFDPEAFDADRVSSELRRSWLDAGRGGP